LRRLALRARIPAQGERHGEAAGTPKKATVIEIMAALKELHDLKSESSC
jgi:hypothetical protein